MPRIACPFHDDTFHSLTLADVSGTYFCHSCGRQGLQKDLPGLATMQEGGRKTLDHDPGIAAMLFPYEPKAGDVVRVRKDYTGHLGDQHKGLIGIVHNPSVLHEGTRYVQFFGATGERKGAYRPCEIESLPVGTIIYCSGNAAGAYEGITDRYPVNGVDGRTCIIQIRRLTGEVSELAIDNNMSLRGHKHKASQTSHVFDRLASSNMCVREGCVARQDSVMEYTSHCPFPGFKAQAKTAYMDAADAASSIPVTMSPGADYRKPEPVQRHYVNGGASSHEIAWLMFITDPAIKAFAQQRGEGRPEGILRVLKIAWGRDENGWCTDYKARAAAMSCIEIQRESDYALPGSWEICTCPTVETTKGFKVTGRSPTCKKHEFEAP